MVLGPLPKVSRAYIFKVDIHDDPVICDVEYTCGLQLHFSQYPGQNANTRQERLTETSPASVRGVMCDFGIFDVCGC